MPKTLAIAIPIVLIAAFLIFLRPTPFHGDTSYVIVVGDSMEPTLSEGDLVIAKRASSYDVGDIVAYRSPYDPVVIHRIVGIDGDTFITQGDNNDSVDPWDVTTDMILGKSLLAAPYVGSLFYFLREPIRLAVFIVALFFALSMPSLLLTPTRRTAYQRRKEQRLKIKRCRRERALARWLPLPVARLLSHVG